MKKEWINIKDDLPDEDVIVICFPGYDKVKVINKIFYTWSDYSERWINWNQFVSHWMEKPDPPESV